MNLKHLDVIKAPVVTEKANLVSEKENKYSFYVDPKSNKTEIKIAIEKQFNVKVDEIKTITVNPKHKRVGRYSGLTNHKKKAIVKLADGQTIKFE